MKHNVILDHVEEHVDKWLNGVKNEIKFWDDWCRTHGLQWKDDFYLRTTGRIHIAQYNEPFIDYKNQNFHVLDAGCGPISNFGIIGKFGKINLSACDALADIYTTILKKYNLIPYVHTDFSFFECLQHVYRKNFFDYVHVSNALDHSFDPLLGIYNLLSITKLGKYIMLYHTENEAVRENYSGLHQWNLTIDNNQFIIWNNNMQYNISRIFDTCCNFQLQRQDDNQNKIIVTIQKIDYLPFDILYNSFYLISRYSIKYYIEQSINSNSIHPFKNLRNNIGEIIVKAPPAKPGA